MVVSTAEIEHLESDSSIAPFGDMLASDCKALIVVRPSLDCSTVPASSLLGIVKPDKGVTLALASSSEAP